MQRTQPRAQVQLFIRRNPSIEQHRHKAEDQNGKDHEIQLEDLASVDDKIPETVSGTDEFSDDDADEADHWNGRR